MNKNRLTTWLPVALLGTAGILLGYLFYRRRKAVIQKQQKEEDDKGSNVFNVNQVKICEPGVWPPALTSNESKKPTFLSVTSFNTLRRHYGFHENSWTPYRYKDWTHRRQLLMQLLKDINSDIFCLQETELRDIETDFAKPLAELGYRYLTAKPSGRHDFTKPSIFYKTDKFTLLWSKPRSRTVLAEFLINGSEHRVLVVSCHLQGGGREKSSRYSQARSVVKTLDHRIRETDPNSTGSGSSSSSRSPQPRKKHRNKNLGETTTSDSQQNQPDMPNNQFNYNPNPNPDPNPNPTPVYHYPPPEKSEKSKVHDESYFKIAKELGETCYRMYANSPTKVAPEIINFRPGIDDFEIDAGAAHSMLRPEAVESFYHLYRATKDEKWRRYAWDVFLAIRKWGRLDQGGYANIKDVRKITKKSKGFHDDRMESFFLSETLKYIYLIFVEDGSDPLPLSEFVFNTEAHALPIRT